MLCVFKTCTLHKLTHLFAVDVMSPPFRSPRQLGPLAERHMATGTGMLLTSNNFLCTLMGPHAHILDLS